MLCARILDKGVIPCFEQGLTDASGEPVNAEVSAAVWDGTRLVLASDKNVPGASRSPVFALACTNDGRPRPETLVHYTAELIRGSEKYEDFALSADGQYMVATTGFDRVAEDSSELDHYNRMVVWPVDDPDAPRLVAESEDEGVPSSVALRRDLGAALGAAYFKIEGLAAVPGPAGQDARLLFGVREVGDDHEHFDYVCRVVAAPYRIADGALVFTGAVEVIYAFDPARWPQVRYTVGLSSLEYDPHNDRLLLLTSYEITDANGDDQIGAYMWSVSLPDFYQRAAPELVQDINGQAFEFVNKAEGVAVLDANRVFVVYDNDRALALEADHPRDARQPHEAPYTVLSID